MSFGVVEIGAGAFTAVAGFVGGIVHQRVAREARFETRIDRRLKELEAEVVECRKRDSEVLILRMGMRMIVPEMQRLDRGNPVLAQLANALSALPEDGDAMGDLLAKLLEVPWAREGIDQCDKLRGHE